MSNVNGYFAAPALPTLPAAPPAPQPYGAAATTPTAPGAWPTPVVVPVNNAPAYNQANIDSYIQSAVAAAPLTAGAMPGRTAANVVSEGYQVFGRRVARSGARTAARSTAKSVRARSGSGVGQAGGGILGGIMGAIKTSVIVNGLFSLAVNGYQVYTKKQTMSQGGANFSGDLMSAVAGGAAGGVASAAGTAILCSAFGMTAGLPLTLIGIGLGIGGYILGDTLLKQTKIYNDVKTKVGQLLA